MLEFKAPRTCARLLLDNKISDDKSTISNMDPQICNLFFRNPIFPCMLPKKTVFQKKTTVFLSVGHIIYDLL